MVMKVIVRDSSDFRQKRVYVENKRVQKKKV